MLYSFHLIAFNAKAKAEPTCLAREKNTHQRAKWLTSTSRSSPSQVCWELGWVPFPPTCAYLGSWSFSATLDGNPIPARVCVKNSLDCQASLNSSFSSSEGLLHPWGWGECHRACVSSCRSSSWRGHSWGLNQRAALLLLLPPVLTRSSEGENRASISKLLSFCPVHTPFLFQKPKTQTASFPPTTLKLQVFR